MNNLRNIFHICCAMLLFTALVGCDRTAWVEAPIYGTLSVDVVTDTRTRAVSEVDASDYTLRIRRDGRQLLQGVMRDLSSRNLLFKVGDNYTVEAENCSRVEAEEQNNHWGCPHYVGVSEPFSLLANENKHVQIVCKRTNASVTVAYDVTSLDSYPQLSVVVYTDPRRKITFDSRSTHNRPVAYFSVDPSLSLSYEIHRGNGLSVITGELAPLSVVKNVKLDVQLAPSGELRLVERIVDAGVNDHIQNESINPYW